MADKWESDHLWLCLLALGFRPKRHCGVKLGRDMFAKPNSRAFHVVALFLFTKLDKHRARQTFKLSEFRKQGSPKFRKHCCLWLREISKQKEIGIPRITPSVLLCPGGAKFVHVIYLFARYIMIENMKKLSVGTGIPFAEAIRWRPDDMYIAEARHRVAYNKLLQNLRREDFVIKEYREKAQVLIREIKRTVSEYEVVQKQCFRMKQNNQNKNDTTDKIQKVRSMWTLIVEILTSLKKEKEVVDSVLQDCANPCVLDGTDVAVRVPGLLTYRVESNIHGFCTGNLYEDGKLNFLTVIQLLNEALMTLRDEPCPCELKEFHRIEDMVTSYKNALQELKTQSQRRRQQHCEPKQGSISRKQEIWESKWKTILGQCPFNLIFKDDHQLASLQSLSSSDEDEDSVLCQSFSDNNDSHHEECHGKNDGALETMTDTALVPSRCDFMQHEGFSASEATDSHFLSPSLTRLSVPLLSEASNNGDLSIEKNLHTCVGDKKLVPPKIFRNGQKEFPTSAMEENADENTTQPKSPVKKDSLEKARDELAEQIVKAVMSESTDNAEEEGMALDDVFSSLSFNTFLMRKQITQTPENLLTEIRSSWRRAIQTEGSLDLELSSAEVVTEESSMNATPSMQEEVDSSFVCSEPASPVSDLGPSVSEKKSQLSSTESSFQEQVSHIFESSDSKTSGIQESERTESEELDCSALSGSSVEDLSQTSQNAEKSMNIPGTCLKSDSRTNTGPSDHCSSFLMGGTLRWNISALNTVGDETTDMGILDETLPEIDSIDLSMSPSSESVFNTMDSENLMDDSKNKEDIKILDLDIQSPPNSREVLKKTASKSEEELHQKHNGDKSRSNRARLSTISEGGEDDDPSMDEGFTTMPLPNSPNESKYSLSSLLVSGQEDGT
ncbi:PREDICTED: HAUS augmin-like complex subunit 6 isoform X1 [Pseudopodoces humilis]|uniref:HAUS augmin-like complex subunit 6 isoform X1 n=2 Tax=Pseudopodoces humilis TaxID=181119 RepID=UPI0006B83B45|nr:PREDICTED: HAUS augmin-like complex subunit 6 isoform X1 [Pseudopodoces humilis]XP_014107807.1 PREDICTED: HAUS augmin-like complex subunit 6 isoform X1 [Pseudopodoces humilis]XP_014107808.1 PREDICTED: HAUS augmin-like complex subunit 6 isoform X1 [Pseudopodoces humilis]XP_014107809.1 PREDICTED: HAUS augmin-like complex subunit 6 isoform X1 [Pseudopodoces humilis]